MELLVLFLVDAASILTVQTASKRVIAKADVASSRLVVNRTTVKSVPMATSVTVVDASGVSVASSTMETFATMITSVAVEDAKVSPPSESVTRGRVGGPRAMRTRTVLVIDVRT